MGPIRGSPNSSSRYCRSCRSTTPIAGAPSSGPAPDTLNSRQQLYQHAAHYDEYDYDDNFLWYAPEETIDVVDYVGRLWTGCDFIPSGVGELCPKVNKSVLGKEFNTTTANPDPHRAAMGRRLDLPRLR